MEDGQFHTNFSKETWETFKSHLRQGPIQMLNLIRLRAHAEYPDGRATTGAEAYSDLSAPIFQELGGKTIWRGEHELTVVGPKREAWEVAFIAEYPSVQSFVVMMRNETYHDAMRHRQAGVLDSRVVRFGSRESGLSFAG